MIAAVDSSKLGLSTLASFAALGEMDVLLTDTKVPEGLLRELGRRGWRGWRTGWGELGAAERAG